MPHHAFWITRSCSHILTHPIRKSPLLVATTTTGRNTTDKITGSRFERLPGDGKKSQTEPTPPTTVPPIVAPSDAARLQQLKERLTALIEQSPALRAFKDQIRISITNEGLRIEIVDSQNRPMFPSGSSKLQPYAVTILTQIGAALNDVENRISIAGHTDAVPYTAGPEGYSNWELSSDRANAARRAPRVGRRRHARREAAAGARTRRCIAAEQQRRRRTDQSTDQYPRAE